MIKLPLAYFGSVCEVTTSPLLRKSKIAKAICHLEPVEMSRSNSRHSALVQLATGPIEIRGPRQSKFWAREIRGKVS